MVQISGEAVLEFATAVQQLTHREFVGQHVVYIQTEATNAFINEIRDQEVKQHLLGGGDRTLIEALKYAS
jgi:hypothetical protein